MICRLIEVAKFQDQFMWTLSRRRNLGIRKQCIPTCIADAGRVLSWCVFALMNGLMNAMDFDVFAAMHETRLAQENLVGEKRRHAWCWLAWLLYFLRGIKVRW